MSVPGAPDLIAAFKAGSIPHVPQGVVNLIQARKQKGSKADSGPATGSIRESSYALAALEGCSAELAAAAPGQRNETLNALAYRLGRMVARDWIPRAEVEAALTGAMTANGYIADDGADAAAATLRSGIDAGMGNPHEDLRDQDKEARPQPAAPSLLVRIDLARYDSEPVPAREWGVLDRFPRLTVALLSGHGGVVDDEGELVRRLQPILKHYGASYADVAPDLHIFSLVDRDDETGQLLATVGRDGIVRPTPLYDALLVRRRGRREAAVR